MKKEIYNVDVLRNDFLNPEERFLVSYLKNFNRKVERKWQLENLALFSDE